MELKEKMSNFGQLLGFATTVVSEAGRIATGSFRHPVGVTEKGPGDPVTQADLAIDAHIASAISKAFPDHGLVAEESGARNNGAEYVWILDPIDGTRYFAEGVPLYSISLALHKRNEAILGVVFNPETGEMFTAERGGGATLNGARIHCSARIALADSMICVEIPHRRFSLDKIERAMQKLDRLVRHADRVRIIGVSALGLCYCAAGGFGAYVNLSGTSKIWDLAAGQVILSEAGGRITTTANNEIVGGPPALHDALVDLLGIQPG